MARGMFVICDGTDRRQAIAELEEHPEGWIRVYLVRQGGEQPEALDFSSFTALAEYASRAQPMHQLRVAKGQS